MDPVGRRLSSPAGTGCSSTRPINTNLLTSTWNVKMRRRSFGSIRFGLKAAADFVGPRRVRLRNLSRIMQLGYWRHGMSISGTELREVTAQNVSVSEDSLAVDLSDGRTITVPLAWFPRLVDGKQGEHGNFRLIGNGTGVHWPDLDEDISVESLLAGRGSGETQTSLVRWLHQRRSSA
jgi:hypothetical protein